MKKRKWLGIASIAMMAVSHPVAVLGETGSVAESQATVNFLPNEAEVTPVNPLDPDQPVTPEPGENNPHAPSTKGPLSINYISNLQFGGNQASGHDAVYQVRPDRVVTEAGTIVEVPNYVQVTDHRGTNTGWVLTVQQNGTFVNGDHELEGTELIFQNPAVSGKSGMAAFTPIANKQFSLSADGQSAVVMTASENQGMGTWVDHFGEDTAQAPSSVTLKVPGASKKVKGNYTTSLIWTLADVPVTE